MFANKDDQGQVKTYELRITDGAYLANKSLPELSKELMKKNYFGRWVVEKKVVGNDLWLKIIRFNDFSKVTEAWNTNFSNADLTSAFFSQADLTNADLSNATLSKTILTNAILNNVVLNGAILNCINHPICVQE